RCDHVPEDVLHGCAFDLLIANSEVQTTILKEGNEAGNGGSEFCVAAAPAIKSTSQISPNVDVHAIMDDISLTGDAQGLSVAVPVLITELAKVGLRINLKKSVVLKHVCAFDLLFSNKEVRREINDSQARK
ncbi:Hypothetical protein, putative, partial [Bodo saltans]